MLFELVFAALAAGVHRRAEALQCGAPALIHASVGRPPQDLYPFPTSERRRWVRLDEQKNVMGMRGARQRGILIFFSFLTWSKIGPAWAMQVCALGFRNQINMGKLNHIRVLRGLSAL